MKKNLLSIVLIVLALCVSVTYLTGCAKKAAVKDQVTVTPQAERPAVAPAAPPAVKPDDAAARERALREQALRDQAAREAAARDKAAKDAKEAADRAKKEGAARAAAILKELKIADIHFDYDKYNLKPEAQEILKAGAPAYLKYRDHKLVVEGHCDERGTAEYNLALGQRRADAAAKYLIDLGIEKDRVKTISYGEEMPLDKGQSEEAWAKNRRAHFVIFPPVK